MTDLEWVESLREDLLARHMKPEWPRWDWAQCGTAAQYRKHLRHQIPPCIACREAERRRVNDETLKRRRRREAGRRDIEAADLVRGVLWRWKIKSVPVMP